MKFTKYLSAICGLINKYEDVIIVPCPAETLFKYFRKLS